MEQSLRKFSILFALLMLCACRHWEPFTYETYAPLKESLSFINDSICIYRQCNMHKNGQFVWHADTCGWKYEEHNWIVLTNKSRNDKSREYTSTDSLQNDNADFTLSTCPKWYNIKDTEFKQYPGYKYPLYFEPLTDFDDETNRVPFNKKYGSYHHVNSDIVMNMGRCIAMTRKTNTRVPSFFFPVEKRFPKAKMLSLFLKNKVEEHLCSWIMDSYEYINYKVNYERKVEFDVNSILGKQFTYLENLYKKESVHFVNDSVCMHVASKRKDVSSPYMPIAIDTCRYTTKNNLIAIDFYKDSPCDTLTYGNGILFYSKVYQDPRNKKYTHIVKPFIDENVKWKSKSDSIKMIMSTYFNVYVPINLLPHTISVSDENNLQEIEQIKSLIVEDQKNRRLGEQLEQYLNDVLQATEPSIDDISKWLSVDPLADKYPNISPYAYCGWNPVNRIDPDGCDTFNVCKQDRTITCISNSGHDVVRFVDSEGNVKKGIGGDLLEMTFEKNSISIMDGISGFIVQGDDTGTNLFKFLANSSAMIEWTQLMFGEKGIGLNYISTSWGKKNNSSTNHVMNKYFLDDEALREHIHNHPLDAFGVPSGIHDRWNKTTGNLEKAGTWGDIGVRNSLLLKYPDAVFKIYTNIGEYVDYTNQYPGLK